MMQEVDSSTTEANLPQVPSKAFQVGEIFGVLAVGAITILIGIAIYGQGIVASILSVWAANLLMMGAIHWGLVSRGQSWSHLGLQFGVPSGKTVWFTFLKSIPVFVVSTTAFVTGAILMAILVGRPEPMDVSKYDYLQGNLGMTLLALASVYFVSSFAEEVIYRGFLLTRLSELGSNTKWARYSAVVLSSLVFGLVHSDWGIAGMVQATCMGLALGISFLVVRRNLWVTIMAHAYMDTLLVLQMYLAD